MASTPLPTVCSLLSKNDSQFEVNESKGEKLNFIAKKSSKKKEDNH